MSSISDVKHFMMKPAVTSQFDVSLFPPTGNNNDLKKLLKAVNPKNKQNEFNLMCSEASLPGSTLNTQEITGDHHGVTEYHAYRRMYDGRIDLSFYVEAETYKQIRFFEEWIRYIEGNNPQEDADGGNAIANPNYFYRVKYPSNYMGKMLIRKFDKNFDGKNVKNSLEYTFTSAYPISISSMPLSYGPSDILKCNVSMSYSRYYVKYVE